MPSLRRSEEVGRVAWVMTAFGAWQLFLAVLFQSSHFPFPIVTYVLFIVGPLNFVAAAGLLLVQRWGWFTAIAVLSLDIIFAFPIGSIRSIHLIGLLSATDVRREFNGARSGIPGAYPVRAAPAKSPSWDFRAPPYSRPEKPPPASRPKSCQRCGAPLDPGAAVCSSCRAPVA